jgi:hypothetical protein
MVLLGDVYLKGDKIFDMKELPPKVKVDEAAPSPCGPGAVLDSLRRSFAPPVETDSNGRDISHVLGNLYIPPKLKVDYTLDLIVDTLIADQERGTTSNG